MLPLSDRPDRFPTLRRAFVPAPGGGCARAARPALLAAQGPLRAQDRGRRLDRRGGDAARPRAAHRGGGARGAARGLVLPPPAPGPRGSRTRPGDEIGVVEDVLETGGDAQVLVVRGPAGETLLPFAAGFVTAVDLAGGRIVARPAGVPRCGLTSSRSSRAWSRDRSRTASSSGRATRRPRGHARPRPARLHRRPPPQRRRRAVRRRPGHGDEGRALLPRGRGDPARRPGGERGGGAPLSARPPLRPGRGPAARAARPARAAVRPLRGDRRAGARRRSRPRS